MTIVEGMNSKILKKEISLNNRYWGYEIYIKPKPRCARGFKHFKSNSKRLCISAMIHHVQNAINSP